MPRIPTASGRTTALLGALALSAGAALGVTPAHAADGDSGIAASGKSLIEGTTGTTNQITISGGDPTNGSIPALALKDQVTVRAGDSPPGVSKVTVNGRSDAGHRATGGIFGGNGDDDITVNGDNTGLIDGGSGHNTCRITGSNTGIVKNCTIVS